MTFYHEINLYAKDKSEKEILQNTFQALEANVDGISTNIVHLPAVKNILPNDKTLSCPIDYPNGLNDTSMRQHSVITAIRKGANVIDLVVNSIFIVDKKEDKLIQDIEAILQICKKNGVTLRVMLDYRLFEPRVFMRTVKLLVERGIEYFYPSTGHFLDSYVDNLLAAQEIQTKYKVMTIVNGNIWHETQYDNIHGSGVFGIRFKSPHNLSFIKNGV